MRRPVWKKIKGQHCEHKKITVRDYYVWHAINQPSNDLDRGNSLISYYQALDIH